MADLRKKKMPPPPPAVRVRCCPTPKKKKKKKKKNRLGACPVCPEKSHINSPPRFLPSPW
ncbi:hypothetical protein CKAH01_10650 [Colletotrichum kahawae]|uniref:Uncharacterized protein n=1 Tax=Colletotrichum kahawae TaxID=34407 RepID=A0AAE0CXG1_COLKA|nr:hypothetical protein CKAH01_10650 [Colletotrichum kahawae]